MNRYYAINTNVGLFGDHGVQRLSGRSGTWGQFRLDWYGSEGDAEITATELVKTELSRVYVVRS